MSKKEIKQTCLSNDLCIHSDQKSFTSNCHSLKCSGHANFPECRNRPLKKEFTCKICSSVLSSRYRLKQHLKTHVDEKAFIGEKYPETFSENELLNKHLRSHSEEKPFICELCSKRFTQKSSLNIHLRIHTGEKSYNCEICSKRFTQKSNLNTHLQIQARQKPFICEICSKKFFKTSLLTGIFKYLLLYTHTKVSFC